MYVCVIEIFLLYCYEIVYDYNYIMKILNNLFQFLELMNKYSVIYYFLLK